MNLIPWVIKNCPTKYGLKLRKYYLLYKGAKLGKHCRFFIGSFLYTKSKKVNITIGFNTILAEDTTIIISEFGNLAIGSHVRINSDADLLVNSGSLLIGDHTRIGPSVRFIAENYVITNRRDILGGKGTTPSTINVGRNVLIGASATILAGVTIGDNSVIGAGSVVTKSIPSESTYAGNPAKQIK